MWGYGNQLPESNGQFSLRNALLGTLANCRVTDTTASVSQGWEDVAANHSYLHPLLEAQSPHDSVGRGRSLPGS